MTKELKKFLDYYAGTSRPGYAVHVTGQWGAGKTHYVKDNLRSCAYVKLYGLSSVEEIHGEVFAAVAPERGRLKTITAGLEALRSLKINGLSVVAGALASAAAAIARKNLPNEKVIVFDDLERCPISDRKVIFGVINTYVEELGFKVVIVSHDDHMPKDDNAQLEKIVGQQIKVIPDIDSALDTFTADIANNQQVEWIKKHHTDIKSAFRASASHNLRLLRYAVIDLCRLYEALDDVHAKHESASRSLSFILVALGIEWRLKSITREHIRKVCNPESLTTLSWRQATKNSSDSDNELEKFIEKYSMIQSLPFTLAAARWESIICDGLFDEEAIRDDLENSPLFKPKEDFQPWELLWDSFQHDVSTLEHALEAAQNQIEQFEPLPPPHILHTFAILIKYADQGIIEKSISEIENACTEHLQKLKELDNIPPYEFNAPRDLYINIQEDKLNRGYAISESSSSSAQITFKHLREILNEMRIEATLSLAKKICSTGTR